MIHKRTVGLLLRVVWKSTRHTQSVQEPTCFWQAVHRQLFAVAAQGVCGCARYVRLAFSRPAYFCRGYIFLICGDKAEGGRKSVISINGPVYRRVRGCLSPTDTLQNFPCQVAGGLREDNWGI